MAKSIYDNLLLLKDAGAVTATAAGTVAAAARVVDIGTGLVEGKMVIDVGAVDVTGAQTYRVALQGSNDITFATGVVEMASADVRTTGRREVSFVNEVGVGNRYRYARVMQTLTGAAPNPSLNATVFLTKR